MSSSNTLSDLVSDQVYFYYAILVILMLVHILADRKYISVGKEHPVAQYCLCDEPKPEKKKDTKHNICSQCKRPIKYFNPSFYLVASWASCVALPWIVCVWVTFIEPKFGPKLEKSDVDDIYAGTLAIAVIVTALRFLFRHCNSISRQLAKSPQNTECNTARLTRYSVQKHNRQKENCTFSSRYFLEPCVLSPAEQSCVYAIVMSSLVLPMFAVTLASLIPAVCLMCIVCIKPDIIEAFLLHGFDVKRLFKHKPTKEQAVTFVIGALEKETVPEKREILLKCLCELERTNEGDQILLEKEAKEEPESKDVKEELMEKTERQQKLRTEIEALNSELDALTAQTSSQTTVNA